MNPALAGRGALWSAPRSRWALPTSWLRALPRARSRMFVLILLLPMFGQSFHYMKIVPPLWALSKAWPVLTLPLAFGLLALPRPDGSRQMLISFTWILLVPSFIAIVTFQQNFFLGLLAQTKMLPLLYFFTFYVLLAKLNPTPQELQTAILAIGVATFALLVAFAVLLPESAYMTPYKPGDSPLFSHDNRGNRIRMPMFFGMICLFYAYRRFLARPGLGWAAAVAGGFYVLLQIVRMRSFVLGAAAMLVLNALRLGGTRTRLSTLALAPVGLMAIFMGSYMATAFSTDASTGIDTRWISSHKALEFLGVDPWHWAFGVGTISPIDPAGLMTWFSHFFFLADITWLGVVFEYGLVGAALILGIAARALLLLARARALEGGGLFLGALSDYLLYAVIISPLNPLTLAPGELTMIAAIAAWRIAHVRTRDASAW